MKDHVWAIILAVGAAFFAAGVVGMVVEAIFHPTQPFWISFLVFVLGLIMMLVSIFHSQIYKAYKKLKSKVLLIWNVTTRMKESDEFLKLKDQQRERPEQWLYPVVQYIDLNRQGSAHNDNDVYVRFQIDSHLLFEIKEFYIFGKLCFAIQETSLQSESDWYEIKMTGNAPIRRLARASFSDAIHLMGESAQEQTLLKWMQDFREGKPLLAMVKIGVKFNKDDKLITENLKVLEGNGTRYIVPMNDYRME